MKKLVYGLMFGFSFISNASSASLDCTSAVILQHQEIPICSSYKLSDNTAVFAKFSCNGYQVELNCNLQSSPNLLSLSIVGPNGETASTTSENELKLMDADGNGVLVRCTAE